MEHNKAYRMMGSVLITSAVVFLLLIEVIYRIVCLKKGYSWIMPGIEAFMAGSILLGVLAVFFLWVKIKKELLVAAYAMTALIFAAGIWSFQDIPVIKLSPDKNYTLILAEEQESNELSVYRRYYYFFKKERKQLPIIKDSLTKIQWIQEDICAVTGFDANNKQVIHIETFGDRGNGISYTDPYSGMRGNWTDELGRIRLTIDKEIMLQTDEESLIYTTEECTRYGTIALSLGKDADWILSMNTDCQLIDGKISQEGTLSLQKTSEGSENFTTAPVILHSNDERPVGQKVLQQMEKKSLLIDIWKAAKRYLNQQQQEKLTQAQKDRAGILEIKELASSNPKGEGFETVQNDIFFVETAGKDILWDLRNILKAYQESKRINGFDKRQQILTIQKMAGNDTVAAYEIKTSEFTGKPGVYGQAADVSKTTCTYKFGIVKTAYGYYCKWFGGLSDPSLGLEGEKQDCVDVSKEAGYTYFLAGKYDTENMYELAKTPQEGLVELYDAVYVEEYPKGIASEYDQSPSMCLNEQKKIYLLYDGIAEDGIHYRYQKVRFEDTVFWNSRYQTQEIYEVYIRRGISEIRIFNENDAAESDTKQSTSEGNQTEEKKNSVSDEQLVTDAIIPGQGEILLENYNDVYEQEQKLDGIIYRMIVLDAALGNRVYGLIKSYDNGNTWYQTGTDPFASHMGNSIEFTFLTQQFGFASLSHNGGACAMLYVTVDGGQHYTPASIEEKEMILDDGSVCIPFDYPMMPYIEDGKLYMLCGQGADGDYEGGDTWILARYRSEDQGNTFQFEKLTSGLGR